MLYRTVKSMGCERDVYCSDNIVDLYVTANANNVSVQHIDQIIPTSQPQADAGDWRLT